MHKKCRNNTKIQAALLLAIFSNQLAMPLLAVPPTLSDRARHIGSELHDYSNTDVLVAQLTPAAIINEIRNHLKDIIRTASESASRNSFEIYSYAQMLLSQLDALANSIDDKGNRLIDKAMDALDQKEKQVVTDFQRSVATLAAERDLTARQVKEIVNLTASSLSVLPGSKDYPRVNAISPFYLARMLLDNSTDENVTISIDGLFLSGYQPSTLLVAGNSCSKANETDVRIVFTCPRQIFQRDRSLKSVDYITGQLSIFGKLNVLDRLLNRKPKPKVYSVGLSVLPNTLGTVSIDSFNEAEIQHIPGSTSSQNVSQTRSFSAINNFCANALTGTWPILKSDPSPLVKIDTSFQPRISEYTGNRTRGFDIQQVTESNIIIGYHLDNNRSREERFGCSTGAFNDRRAWLGINVNYQEKVTTVTKPRDVTIRPRNTTSVIVGSPLTWGKDVQFSLPQNSISFTLTATLFDGRTTIVTPDSLGRRDKYFEVIYDNRAKQVIVKPLPLEQLP